MVIETPQYKINVTYDGVIDVQIRGLWRRQDVDQYRDDVTPLDQQVRDRHGHVRSILQVGVIQSPVTALYFRERNVHFVRPEDRCALVVATILAKLQVKRLAGDDKFGIFTDRDAALAWLRA